MWCRCVRVSSIWSRRSKRRGKRRTRFLRCRRPSMTLKDETRTSISSVSRAISTKSRRKTKRSRRKSKQLWEQSERRWHTQTTASNGSLSYSPTPRDFGFNFGFHCPHRIHHTTLRKAVRSAPPVCLSFDCDRRSRISNACGEDREPLDSEWKQC